MRFGPLVSFIIQYWSSQGRYSCTHQGIFIVQLEYFLEVDQEMNVSIYHHINKEYMADVVK